MTVGIYQEIERFVPGCEQEERDRAVMLRFLHEHPDALLRENESAHLTASAWVLSPDRTRVVMVWHNLYRSWSWAGGHADGEEDLLAAAMREVTEETGLRRLRPLTDGIFSLECLAVEGHEKRGRYVPSHVHLNVTYLRSRRTPPCVKSRTRTAASSGCARARRCARQASRGCAGGSTTSSSPAPPRGWHRKGRDKS